jgi:ABC-type siderophore export system fused ATPase/permease subunit
VLVWVAAALATITALLDRYTVLRVSDMAFATDIDWRSAAIAILPALVGVSLVGGGARVAAFSVIERFIDAALIENTHRLLAADWRDAARDRPEAILAEISVRMREDARSVAAVVPAFAIMPVTAVWLALHAPLVALAIMIALTAGFAVVKKLTPAALASSAVLAQAETEVGRVTEQMLAAGTGLRLRIARDRDFLTRTLFPPVDDATRATVIHIRSAARLSGVVTWLAFVLVLILLGLTPASDPEDAWVRAIVMIVATLYPLRQVLVAWPAVQRLRGLPAQLRSVGQEVPPAETFTRTAPARWTSIGLHQAVVDPRDTPGLSIVGIGPVDIVLGTGEIVALTGPHAEDRSTLLHLLCGLIPPDRGTAMLDGHPISSVVLRGLCGVLLDPATLAASSTAPADSPRAAALFARFDLMAGRESSAMTEAERTCSALVAMEIQDRPIRLYDERMARVEPRYREAFAETLREARGRGRLCILATSDASMIAMADRVIRMVDGRIDASGEVPR